MTKLLFTSALLLCLLGASFGLSVQPIFDPVMTCMCVFANGSSCCPDDFERPTLLPLSLFAEPIITCDCVFANGTSCCPYDTPIDIRPIISEPIAVADDSFMIMSCMCMFANGSSCCPEDFEKPSHLPSELFEISCDCLFENGTSCCPETVKHEPIISCDCMMLGGQSCCPSTGSPIRPITPISSPIIAHPIISEPIDEPVMEPLVDNGFMIMSCMCMFANGSSCCPEDFARPTHLPKALLEADDEFMILTCDCMMADGQSCC